jgi:hypothetical protein
MNIFVQNVKIKNKERLGEMHICIQNVKTNKEKSRGKMIFYSKTQKATTKNVEDA